MVANCTEMPAVDTVFKAVYQTAFYDHLLTLPVRSTLQAIRDLRLERFLPVYFDFKTGKVLYPEAFDDEVQRECMRDHSHPEAFLERLQREKEGKPEHFSDRLEELNYHLISEVLTLSPTGYVSPLVYKVATGRVSTEVGLDSIRGLYREVLQEITDGDRYTFESLIQAQVLSEYQRFIDELPILEDLISRKRGQSPEDISEMDIVIFTRHGHDGKLILPRSLIP